MAATKTEIKKGTVLACTRCSTVIMHIYEVICNAYAMYLFAVYVCLEKPHQKDDARTAGTSFFFNQVKRRLVRDLAMTSLLTGVQLVKPNETLISSHINIRLVGFKICTPAKPNHPPQLTIDSKGFELAQVGSRSLQVYVGKYPQAWC